MVHAFFHETSFDLAMLFLAHCMLYCCRQEKIVVVRCLLQYLFSSKTIDRCEIDFTSIALLAKRFYSISNYLLLFTIYLLSIYYFIYLLFI